MERPSFVIDLQCYKPRDLNSYIVKELALFGVGNPLSFNFVIKPPRKYFPKVTDLAYVRERIHGIEWRDGYISFNDAIQIVQQVCANAESVYVKGAERVNYLKNNFFSNRKKLKIIDLQFLGCPRFDENRYSLPRCYYRKHLNYYSQTKRGSFSCALQKAAFYANWLKENTQRFSLELSIQDLSQSTTLEPTNFNTSDDSDKSEGEDVPPTRCCHITCAIPN